MRQGAFVPAGLLGAGAVLVGIATLEGGAGLALVVVVPVLYGHSLEFAVGVLLLVAGLFTLPLAFASVEESEPTASAGTPSDAPGASGGLVVIGPIPIFFGSWKNVSTRTRVIVALLGAAVLVGAVLLLVWR